MMDGSMATVASFRWPQGWIGTSNAYQSQTVRLPGPRQSHSECVWPFTWVWVRVWIPYLHRAGSTRVSVTAEAYRRRCVRCPVMLPWLQDSPEVSSRESRQERGPDQSWLWYRHRALSHGFEPHMAKHLTSDAS